jgi:hypothetical protein
MRHSEPFSIDQQCDDNENEQKDEPATLTADEWVERPANETDRPRCARILIGPNGDSQLISTVFSDFHTVTFRSAFDLLQRAMADTNQTALVVSRLVCTSPSPAHFRFTDDSLKVLQEENAGGASEFSEAVSFEILHRMFGARLVKTEMAIQYKWNEWSKKTDYSCEFNGRVFAVSVTRAMHFGGQFTERDALALLAKKLYGCQMSNRDVVAADRWHKQLLHVLTESVEAVAALRSVFQYLLQHEPELVGDTVVLITLCKDAHFLFFNFCAEQSKMEFVSDEQVCFDSTAVTFMAQSLCFDSCKSQSFGASVAAGLALDLEENSEEEEEFYFGFPTREEALANDAVIVVRRAPEGLGLEEEGLMCPIWGTQELGAKGELQLEGKGSFDLLAKVPSPIRGARVRGKLHSIKIRTGRISRHIAAELHPSSHRGDWQNDSPSLHPEGDSNLLHPLSPLKISCSQPGLEELQATLMHSVYDKSSLDLTTAAPTAAAGGEMDRREFCIAMDSSTPSKLNRNSLLTLAIAAL